MSKEINSKVITKRKMSKSTLVKILIPILLVLCLVGTCIGLAYCDTDAYDEGFWLLTEDISDYIKLNPNDYRNAILTIDPVDEVTMDDVITYIRKAQIEAYTGKVDEKKDGYVLENDLVSIWYRGEVNMGTAEEPVWVEFLGGSNYNDTSAYSLRIGSGQFIDGFEDKLKEVFSDSVNGMNIADTNILVYTGTNNVVETKGADEKNIVNISYSYSFTDADGKTKTGTMTDRVDLTKNAEGNYTGVSRYSAALRDALFGRNVKDYVRDGDSKIQSFTESFDMTQDLKAETVTVTNVRITGIVKEEKTATFTISFPDEYSSEALEGKEARWFVVIDKISRPTELQPLDTVTYSFVSNTLGVTYQMLIALPESHAILTAAEINEIGNDTAKQQAAVLTHYKTYILEAMKEERQSTIDKAIQSAFWEYIIDKVEVIKYPEELLDQYIKALRQSAQAEFEEYTSSQGNASISTLNEYLVNYYSAEYFPSTDKIDEGFEKMAKEQLKSEMALYYIAANEKLTMTKSERDKAAEEEMQALIEYYTAYYQQAGQLSTGESLTEQDLANSGITKRSLIENVYLQRVNEYIAGQLRDKVLYNE